MSASIELLRDKGNELSTEQLDECFEEIVHNLTTAKSEDNREAFLELLTNVIHVLTPIDITSYYSNHSSIVSVLYDALLDLLKQDMNDAIEGVLIQLSNFFHQRLTQSLMNSKDIKQMLIDGIVMYFARKFTRGELQTIIFFMNSSIDLKQLDCSLHILLCALENRQNEENNLTEIEAVIDCVCSSTFVHIFRSLHSNEDELTSDQESLLVGCVTRIYRYNNLDKATDLMRKVARSLPDYAQLLIEFVPPRNPIHIKVLRHFVNMLQFLAIDNDVRHDYINDHALMLDPLLVILRDEFLWKQISDNDTTELFDNAANYLFLLSLECNLLPVIKAKPNVSKCMLKLTEAESDRTRLNGYRTLAMIMTEDEVKLLTEPDKITAIFLKYFNSAIDTRQHRRLLENLLLCLKSLAQHEQIRDEFASSSSGIPLLVRCATESQFDSTIVKQRSLELLLVMTFNKQAANMIRDNNELIAHIKILSQSHEVALQRVADGILWKLGNEDQIITDDKDKTEQKETSENTSMNKSQTELSATKKQYEYDIMISYSHNDKELVYQIQERLEKDTFRVWLDRDNMYGSPTRAMSHAIENSEFVFFCMSDSYKKSGFCELEAHYAYKQQCRIIPLIVKGPYRADGWLGLLTTNKIYIDFHKAKSFDEAYSRIIQEINGYRTSAASIVPAVVKDHESTGHVVDIKPVAILSAPSLSRTLPHMLSLWSEDDVKYFLESKNLHAMLPICTGMNGSTLCALHTMCRMNSNGMYESLKTELAQSSSKILPIGTYLKFMEETKKYVLVAPGDTNAVSVVCSIM
ncbi:unnamed protein product [Adineta ricciae]|uniref:TIR domain-containing protein n=1 Tax=Adineta ricciae TaxID=249248 RepID=A0A815VF23_ADIRI|nr:unnamed protein product [Adineta ricciae]